MLVVGDSSNVISFDSSNVVYLVVLVRFFVVDSSNGFVWLISDDSSNVLDLLAVYVCMYEGRASYQYYALQGSE
nr:MAG TPA: hypothetical protein [Caudoviricetes sp.]